MKPTPKLNWLSAVRYGDGPDDEPNFEDFFKDLVDEDLVIDDGVEPQPPSSEPAPQPVDPKPEEVPPTTPPVETPVEVPDPVAQPKPETPKEQPTTKVPEETTPPAVEPQQVNLDQIRGELEKAYAISDDDADLLTTDPQKIFPQLAANLHMQVMSHVLHMVERVLPQRFEQYTAHRAQGEELEQRFATVAPDLNLKVKEEFEAVETAATLVGQRFKSLSVEEKLKKVSEVARVILGRQAPTPAPQITPDVVPSPKPVSPTPARGTSRPGAPAALSEWDQFVDSLKED